MNVLEQYLKSKGDTFFIVTDNDGKIILPRDSRVLQMYKLIINHGEIDRETGYLYYSKRYYDQRNTVFMYENRMYLVEELIDVSKYHIDEVVMSTDAGTGLLNKQYARKEFNVLIEQSNINNTPFAVIMADIDFFKKINDTYGHPFGDEVLKIVGSIFKGNTRHKDIRGNNTLRGRDIAARYGGEEFLIVLNNVTYERACNIIEKIRRVLSSTTIEFDGKTIKCPNLSYGFVYVSNDLLQEYDISDIDEVRLDLIGKADKALYISKENGRNQVTDYYGSTSLKLKGDK